MKLTSVLRSILFASSASFIAACNANPTDQLSTHKVTTDSNKLNELTLVTWNVEHLAMPIDQGCRPRTKQEHAQLKQYAAKLDADVVALQEVASVAALEQLFPASSWQLFISDRADSEIYDCRHSDNKSTQQKVAYAVRKGLEVSEIKSLADFGLDSPGLRHGLELTVNSELGPVSVLNVHMKSGCFVDNYTRGDTDACQKLAKQVKVLDAWVEEKEASNKPYALLGDFNHRLSAPYNHLRQELMTNTNNTESSLVNTTEDMLGCHPYYPAPIDHIFVGKMASTGLNYETNVYKFQNMKPREMLSDHCAVSLKISEQQMPLTNAVKWQTTSKEYQYLTTKTYQQAAKQLRAMKPAGNDWVVVMDIDETVLDNSQYQVGLDRTGANYSSKTWAKWIKAEQATLVPGVKDFIETVLEQGGKLALVTNRVRKLDNHTWTNMLALGLPLNTENTCLMGRDKADKEAIDHDQIKNDKDLRRQQISKGKASCYNPAGKRKSLFSAQRILMQVGDNIEDFAGVTQEDANISQLAPNKGLILLPNPMYGSW